MKKMKQRNRRGIAQLYSVPLRALFTFFCTGMVLLSACVEEVDPKNLALAEKKVVINSLISPGDDFVKVEVSYSTPILGERLNSQGGDSDIIKDAQVKLSDGSQEMILSYDPMSEVYTNFDPDILIRPGKQYFLEVTVGSTTYTAQCRVPEKAADEITATANNLLDGFRMKVSWQDIPNEENYYWVSGNYSFEDGLSSTLSFYEEAFKSDANRDGATISADVEEYHTYYSNGEEQSVSYAEIQLLTTDENLYEYQKAVAAYDGGDNPFAEPIKVPSNIEGGLGIFAAYLSVKKEVLLE